MVGVVLAADVLLYREGLAGILDGVPDLKVVGVAGSVGDLMMQIQDLDPDVVLLDVGLAGGLGAVRTLRTRNPETTVLAFAVSEVSTDLVAWAQAGIAGFVTSDASIDRLVATIKGTVNGESICSPRLTARLLEDLASMASGPAESKLANARLTSRERDIISLLELGKSNKEIAQALCIAVPTVKNHVHNILEKLEVDRRTEAAAALEHATGLSIS